MKKSAVLHQTLSLWLIMCLFAYVPLGLAAGFQFEAAKKNFESGMRHYESGSYDEAVQQLDIAIGELINIVQSSEKADCSEDALDKAVTDAEAIIDSIVSENSNIACDGVALKKKKEMLWHAHVFLALSKYLSEKYGVENAMVEFDLAKKVLPAKKMDPALFSPKVISFYNADIQEPRGVKKPKLKEIIVDTGLKEKPPIYKRWWFWALLGGGAAAGAAAAASGGSGDGGGGGGGEESIVVSW